jgi:hypothetical protein
MPLGEVLAFGNRPDVRPSGLNRKSSSASLDPILVADPRRADPETIGSSTLPTSGDVKQD